MDGPAARCPASGAKGLTSHTSFDSTIARSGADHIRVGPYRRSVIERVPPLAALQHRERLAGFGLPAEHVPYCLRPRLPGREPRTAEHLADDAPVVLAHLLEDEVAAVWWRAHDSGNPRRRAARFAR